MRRCCLVPIGGIVLLVAGMPGPAAAGPIRMGVWGSVYGFSDTSGAARFDLPDDFATRGGTFVLSAGPLTGRKTEARPDVPGGWSYAEEHIPVGGEFGLQLLLYRPGDAAGHASAGVMLRGSLAGEIAGQRGRSNYYGGYAGTVDSADVSDWAPAGSGIPAGLLDVLRDPGRIHVRAEVTGGVQNILKITLTVDPVPEPTTLAILLAGAGVGAAAAARRRRRAG